MNWKQDGLTDILQTSDGTYTVSGPFQKKSGKTFYSVSLKSVRGNGYNESKTRDGAKKIAEKHLKRVGNYA